MGSIFAAVAFTLAAAGAALNAVLYVTAHNPVSLGAAIFCGLLAIFDIVMMRDMP